MYLFVVDFEATCDEPRSGNPPEIIEFPCVVVDSKTKQVVNEFHYYVRPQNDKILSEFCKNLTGITQEQVDTALSFEEVVKLFMDLLHKYEDPLLITCGDWDFREGYVSSWKINNNKDLWFADSWCNLKIIFQECYGGSHWGMKKMLEELNIPLAGRHHSGIDDARNIASIVIRILNDSGEDAFRITTELGHRQIKKLMGACSTSNYK